MQQISERYIWRIREARQYIPHFRCWVFCCYLLRDSESLFNYSAPPSLNMTATQSPCL